MRLFLPLALLSLAACASTPDPAPAPEPMANQNIYDEATLIADDPLVTASHQGDYLWQCEVPSGTGLWRFMIRNVENEAGSELLLQTPGSDAVMNLAQSAAGDSVVYTAPQGRISIDQRGQAQLDWNGVSRPMRCHKGEQPQ